MLTAMFGRARVAMRPRGGAAWIVVLAASVCAAVISGSAIGARSLWFDEAMSEGFASLPWSMFWVAIFHCDAVHALYYATLHVWTSFFGTAESGLRSLSAVTAIATIPVAYVLGSRLFGRQSGALAAVLLAFNPFLVYYAREARSYSTVILLSGIATLAFLRARDRNTPSAWTIYVVLMVAAAYMHIYASLLIVGHAFGLPPPRRNVRIWLTFMASAALVVLSTMPLVHAILGDDSSLTGWILAPDRWELLAVFVGFAGSGWLLVLEGLLIVGAIAFALRRYGFAQALRPYRLALAWLLLPVVLSYIAAHAKPMFQPRYLSISFLPFVLLCADGLARLRPAATRLAALALIAALSGSAIAAFYLHPREDWRAVVDFIEAHARPNDAGVVYQSIDETPLHYYLARLPIDAPAPHLLYPPATFKFWLRDRDHDLIGAVARHNDVRRLWLIAYRNGNPDAERFRDLRAIEAGIAGKGFVVRQKTRLPPILITLYEREERARQLSRDAVTR